MSDMQTHFPVILAASQIDRKTSVDQMVAEAREYMARPLVIEAEGCLKGRRNVALTTDEETIFNQRFPNLMAEAATFRSSNVSLYTRWPITWSIRPSIITMRQF